MKTNNRYDPTRLIRKKLMPHDHYLHQWRDRAKEKIQFQGLPARICWVGLGE